MEANWSKASLSDWQVLHLHVSECGVQPSHHQWLMFHFSPSILNKKQESILEEEVSSKAKYYYF